MVTSVQLPPDAVFASLLRLLARGLALNAVSDHELSSYLRLRDSRKVNILGSSLALS